MKVYILKNKKKEYETLMNEIKPLIEGMTGKTIEKVTEKMKLVNHILTSEKELKHLFKNKLDELGYKWNFEAKKYEKVSDNTDTAE
jgi:hypothetical protein